MDKYGVVIGRFQPLHLGHTSIINQVLLDGRIPIVFVGSSNKNDSKNPYSFSVRLQMLRAVFGYALDILPLSDNPDWDIWLSKLMDWLPEGDVVLYTSNKPEDVIPYYKCNDTKYLDSYYTECIPLPKVEVKHIGLDISSTKIRESLEKYKHYLDYRVYNIVKENNEKN